MKRVVFDLDGTLLTSNYALEKEFFTSLYGEKANELINNIGVFLDEYEKTFPRYRHDELSEFLSKKSNLLITNNIIDEWIDVMHNGPDKIEDGVIQTLEYLKRKDSSLAVLTNWYSGTQIPRLRRAGILHYFDNIYTGEFVLKPHKKAYLWAKDDFDIEECLFIGDNLDKDYIGPRRYGFDSIIYDKNDKYGKVLKKVKRIDELIER